MLFYLVIDSLDILSHLYTPILKARACDLFSVVDAIQNKKRIWLSADFRVNYIYIMILYHLGASFFQPFDGFLYQWYKCWKNSIYGASSLL